MWCEKSSYELGLLLNLPSFLVVVYLLEMVLYYSDYSSSHSFDCSDYSGFPSNLGFYSDSNFSACSDMHFLRTVPTVVDSADSHTEPTLLASALTDNP